MSAVPAEAPTAGGRTLPANLDAERAVLSAILRDNALLAQVGDMLKPDDFYLEAHRVIYQTLQDLADRGQPLDAITLAEGLHKQALLDRAGGPAYIGDLIDYVGTTVGVKHYAQIVREKALVRRMIRAATEIASEGYEDIGDVHDFLDSCETRIFDVLGANLSGSGEHIRDVLKVALRQLEQLAASEDRVVGVTTGFRDLDELLLGLHASDLLILAARPAMGKTTFAMNIGANAALKGGAAVAVFSLEMSKEQLALRLLSSEARVGLKELRSGMIKDSDWPRLTEAARKLSASRIYVDDTPALSLPDLRAKCRRLKMEDHCDIILVDYLQLMRSGRNIESREQEISEISRGLKALAKELSVPVIALSQLNRSLEQRGDKRPILSDLRESGAIEQDADVIMFIYRDEVYHPDTEDKNAAEIIIGKQRNGPTGTVRLRFFGQYTRFDNYQRDE